MFPNEIEDYEEEQNEPEDLHKYIKIVYQSEPIGERGIVLYLTHFDYDAYKKDQKLKQIPTFEVPYHVKVDRGVDFDGDVVDYTYDMLFKELSNIIHTHYENEIEQLRSYIEMNRIIKPVATTYDERKIIKGNITNSDNIICDVIEGNVINCDNVKVREIRGNTVNCEIYKEG